MMDAPTVSGWYWVWIDGEWCVWKFDLNEWTVDGSDVPYQNRVAEWVGPLTPPPSPALVDSRITDGRSN
jgi:hypothetical protein